MAKSSTSNAPSVLFTTGGPKMAALKHGALDEAVNQGSSVASRRDCFGRSGTSPLAEKSKAFGCFRRRVLVECKLDPALSSQSPALDLETEKNLRQAIQVTNTWGLDFLTVEGPSMKHTFEGAPVLLLRSLKTFLARLQLCPNFRTPGLSAGSRHQVFPCLLQQPNTHVRKPPPVYRLRIRRVKRQCFRGMKCSFVEPVRPELTLRKVQKTRQC
mmetsp:Transcript_121693/g.306139  ORF Transcript_121693/g.306139 Transcript_121693/m.306139 type:complete len:214 (-) Transcript_121693:735-1376(-)